MVGVVQPHFEASLLAILPHRLEFLVRFGSQKIGGSLVCPADLLFAIVFFFVGYVLRHPLGYISVHSLDSLHPVLCSCNEDNSVVWSALPVGGAYGTKHKHLVASGREWWATALVLVVLSLLLLSCGTDCVRVHSDRKSSAIRNRMDNQTAPATNRQNGTHHHRNQQMQTIDTASIRNVRDLLDIIGDMDHNTTIEFVRTPKSKQQNLCWCGCGQTTKSRFVPGHDARFHGLAKRVARGEEAMPETWACDEAKADFLAHVEQERPLHEAREKAREAARAAREEARAAREAKKAKRAVEIVEMVEIDDETAALLAEIG